MARKITRTEKIEMSKKNICWKCGGELVKNKNIIKCSKCNFEMVKV